MSTFKHEFISFVFFRSSAISEINYTNFFIDTQVTSTFEAIRGRRLPDYFPLYLGGQPLIIKAPKIFR